MKTKSLPIVLALALSMTACGTAKENTSIASDDLFTKVELAATSHEEEPDAQEETPENIEVAEDPDASAGFDPYVLYDEFVSHVKDAYTNGLNGELMVDGLAIADVFMYPAEAGSYLGYTRLDINGDGLDELIFGQKDQVSETGSDDVVYDVYTIDNGKICQIVDGWARNRYYLCQGGTIVNEGSGGAAYTSHVYYGIENNSLKIKEAIFTDYIDESQTEIGWFKSDIEAWGADAVPISNEEAEQIMAGYSYEKLQLIPF